MTPRGPACSQRGAANPRAPRCDPPPPPCPLIRSPATLIRPPRLRSCAAPHPACPRLPPARRPPEPRIHGRGWVGGLGGTVRAAHRLLLLPSSSSSFSPLPPPPPAPQNRGDVRRQPPQTPPQVSPGPPSPHRARRPGTHSPPSPAGFCLSFPTAVTAVPGRKPAQLCREEAA